MCRGRSSCSELSANTDLWDKQCPLPPLSWFAVELDLFQVAMSHFIVGNKDACINSLSEVRSEEMQDWFIEHGQMSGRFRNLGLGVPEPAPLDESLRDPLRAPKRYEQAVFKRDGFRCRYCGIKMVSNIVLNTFIKALNSPLFHKGARNLDTHGIIHIFNPVADHVIPWNLGGRTSPDNLVTSCGACNYGKDRYTIEQIGIENPFDRPPIIDGWDGLTSMLQGIKEAEV